MAINLNAFQQAVQQFNQIKQKGFKPPLNPWNEIRKKVDQFLPQAPIQGQVQSSWSDIRQKADQVFSGTLQKAENFAKPTIQNVGRTIASQPLFGTQGIGFTPQIKGPTIGNVFNTLVPKQSALGQLARGNITKVPRALGNTLEEGNRLIRLSATPSKYLTPQERSEVEEYNKNLMLGSIGGAGSTWTKKQLEMVKKGFSPQVRSLVGKFAEMAEQNPTGINRKNLGQLGEYVQSLGETLFGKESVNLTNLQLKNAFDSVMQASSTKGGIGNKFSIGLGIRDIRGGKQKLSELLHYPDDLFQRGYSKSQVDKIGINEYRKIVKENIPPFGHKTFKGGRKLFTDIASQQRAEVETLAGGGSGFKGFSNNLQNAFQNWVNYRTASQIEGIANSKKFTDLDSQGLKGIVKFQLAEDKTGRFGDVKRFFDTKYKQLRDSGIELNYKQDYLPQLWQNSKEEVAQVFERKLGLKPSFTIDSVIKNYQEGIKAGLKPRFEKVSDLAGWYTKRANKAIADRNFFDFLTKESLIQPSNKAPIGWKTLDPDRFPKLRVKTESGEFVGTYSSPPDLADAVNNYLKEPDGVLQNVANLASRLKNIYLSSGIPETGLNFHGLNILVRNTLSANNPVSGFLKGTNYLLRPTEAASYINRNLERTAFASKHGLTLSTEDIAFNRVAKDLSKNIVLKAGQKAGELQKKLFEDPLFQKVIPALKLERFNSIYDDLVKSFPEEEAAKQAAKITNNIFGGINYEQVARSKDFQNALRSAFLASDWMESNLRLGANIAKGAVKFNNPAFKAYRTIIRNLVIGYMGASLTNKLITGKWMHENDPGHTFELQAGETEEGKKRYIRPFGTAADFIRIPTDVAMSLVNGDTSSVFRVIRNRLSPVAGQLVGQLSNTTYLGTPITRQTQTPQEQALARLGELSSVTTPSFLSSPIRYLTGAGDQNIEQTIASAVEAPLRYSKPFQFLSSEEKEAQQFRREESRTSAEKEKEAQKIVNKIKSLKTPEEKKEFLTTLDNQGILTDDMLDLIEGLQEKEDQKSDSNFTKAVRRSSNTNTGKAKFIRLYFQNKTPKQKKQFLLELDEAGILTDDLMDKLEEEISAQRP